MNLTPEQRALHTRLFEVGCDLSELTYKMPENSRAKYALSIAYDLVLKTLEEAEYNARLDFIKSLDSL